MRESLERRPFDNGAMRGISSPRVFDFAQGVIAEPDPLWLARALEAAVDGEFPSPDHKIRIVPEVEGPRGAVVAFTGHHVIASSLDPAEVKEAIANQEILLPTEPRFLSWFAESLGSDSFDDTIDVVLARRGIARVDHPEMQAADGETLNDKRVAFAAETRSDLLMHRPDDGSGVVILGRGLAGRLELSIELAHDVRGAGRAREIAAVALAEVGPDRAVFAQVSAGNSAAIRASLSLGFQPVCGEFLVR